MELDTIRKNLDAGSHEAPSSEDLVPAAVLFPLLRKEAQVHILLTKRTQTVKAHKGQISFPGGVRDQGDESLLVTALRETYEEIGVEPQHVEIIGSLEPVETITSGFLIYTFVGLIPYPYSFRVNGREVAEIVMVPIHFLADPRKWYRSSLCSGLRAREAYHISYGDHLIWGATARILKIFLRQNGIDVGLREELRRKDVCRCS